MSICWRHTSCLVMKHTLIVSTRFCYNAPILFMHELILSVWYIWRFWTAAASKSVVYVLRKVVAVFRLMFLYAAGQWSGLLWGCLRDHGMWQMHWMYYKKHYYLNTTNIFTFWRFGLYQGPLSEDVWSIFLPVLATTLIQRCITIVARTGRRIEQTSSDEGLW